MDEYQPGTVDYTAAAAARRSTAPNKALNVREQRLLAAVSLIGDLGGGWCAGHAPPSPAAAAR